ncbi:MAG: DUF4416 family protein [Fibromonadaceae bacterium]|jgi:hypothetical protein|nr:DUF4416 family protein [Fibromonadaceae bacterium]
MLAKLVAFIIAPQNFEDAWLKELSSCFGEIDYKGSFFPFCKTDYYKAEMGENLQRCVISFKDLIAPERIPAYKSKAINIENKLKNAQGGRILNIDVGYMDTDKVVLPSVKRGPFKLYAGDGFWLDMVLTYAKGDFKPTAWAFADFKENPYKRDLVLIRERYKGSPHISPYRLC